jgi:tetratricopeptide (TPR) repeat protein
MPIVSAENKFKKGLEALIDRNYVEAALQFRRAMDIEHQRHVLQPDMRYLSYYGMCRATAHAKLQEGLHACKRAARVRNRDPEMFLNLGRVYLLAQQKRLAYDAFQTGLDLDREHKVLIQESTRLHSRGIPRPVPQARRGGFFSRVRSAWSRPATISR